MTIERKCRVIIFAVLSILIIGFIFSNSIPSIEESAATSSAIAQLLQPILDPHKKLTEPDFHNLVRKLAHFVEFGALGLCVGGLFAQFAIRQRYVFMLSLAVSVSVAAADETLQYFTGRGNSFKDVVLDSFGAVCGLCVAVMVTRMVSRGVPHKKGDKKCRELS